MITRRKFIVAAVGTAINPFAFFEKAQAYYENTGEVLIVPPRQVDQIIYADFCEDYQFGIGDTSLEPPNLTWRQALVRYFPYAEDEWIDHWGELDWETQASPDYVFQCWQRRDSPAARAYDLLDRILPTSCSKVDGVRRELEFCDGPSPGNSYKGVHASEETTLSLLQIELNRLNSGLLIEVV